MTSEGEREMLGLLQQIKNTLGAIATSTALGAAAAVIMLMKSW